jgi:hypothetical protein
MDLMIDSPLSEPSELGRILRDLPRKRTALLLLVVAISIWGQAFLLLAVWGEYESCGVRIAHARGIVGGSSDSQISIPPSQWTAAERSKYWNPWW